MKVQDLIFFAFFIFLLIKRKSRWAAAAGLICIIISIPLFAKWVFFTAERLTWYSAGFFLLAMMFALWK